MFPPSKWRWVISGGRGRMPYIAFPDVVGVFVYVSGQAEVTDLHHFIVRKQNVSGCQVSVDTLQQKHRGQHVI